MPSEIAVHLRENNFPTAKMKVHVFEAITTENETSFVGTIKDLEEKEFSDLSVMVINQTSLDSYMNYRWQWEN
jgi:cobalt-precorrin-7 (C5)-methyltransferase